MRIVLKAINGLMKSKVIDVSEQCRYRIYFAFFNNFNDFKYSYRKDYLDTIEVVKKLAFEPTGRIFKDGKRKPIYEYELVSIE